MAPTRWDAVAVNILFVAMEAFKFQNWEYRLNALPLLAGPAWCSWTLLGIQTVCSMASLAVIIFQYRKVRNQLVTS